MKTEDDFGNFDEPIAEVKESCADDNNWGNFDEEPETVQKGEETGAKSEDDFGNFDEPVV